MPSERLSSAHRCRRFGPSAAALLAIGAPVALGQLVPEWVATHGSGTVFTPVAFALDPAGASFVAATFEPTAGDSDIALIKYDSLGGMEWSRTYTGPVGQDLATDVVIAADGASVFLVGRSVVQNHNSDFLVVKYDTAGNRLWERFFNGPGSSTDDPRDAAATPDGGVVVTGGVWNGGERLDYATVKYTGDGSLAWAAYHAGDGRFLFNDDSGDDVAVTPQGDVVVSGFSTPAIGGSDVLTFKYDGQTGAVLWSATYSTSANENPRDVEIAPDGDVVVFGVDPFGIDRQWFVVRYDGVTGAERWRSLRDPGFDETPAAVITDAAGHVYVTGATDPDGDDGNFNQDLVVLSFDGGSGSLRWESHFGESGINRADFGFDLIEDDGVIYVAGSSRSSVVVDSTLDADAIILKYASADGALLDIGAVDSTENGGPIRTDSFRSIHRTSTGLRVAGSSTGDVGVLPRLLLAEFALAASPHPGDVDGDGDVDLTDLASLLAAFGSCSGEPGYAAAADFDGSACVDLGDLAILLANFGA